MHVTPNNPVPLCLDDIHRPSLARRSNDPSMHPTTRSSINAPETCDSMRERDYRYDVSGLQASS